MVNTLSTLRRHVTRQQQKKRGRPRKFPPGVRPIRLGPKRPRGRPSKRDVYDDLNADRDGTDTDSISSDQTFGDIKQNLDDQQIHTGTDFKWELLGNFTEDLLWPITASLKLSCFKRVEKRCGAGPSSGDFFVFRCANWEVTRCRIYLHAQQKTNAANVFGCSMFGEHTELCRTLPQIEYGNKENVDMNNSSVVGVHSTFDDEDLIELIEQDLFPCKDAGAPAVAIGHHTHPNAAAQSTSTPFTNGSSTVSSSPKEIVPKIEPTPSTSTSDFHFRTVPRRSMRLNPEMFADIELLDESSRSTPSRKRPHFEVEQRAEEAKMEIATLAPVTVIQTSQVETQTQNVERAEIGVQTDESKEQKSGNEAETLIKPKPMVDRRVQTDHWQVVSRQMQTDKIEAVKIETVAVQSQTESTKVDEQSMQTEPPPRCFDKTLQTDEVQVRSVVQCAEKFVQTEEEPEHVTTQVTKSFSEMAVQTDVLVSDNRERTTITVEQEVQTTLTIHALPEAEQSIEFHELKEGETFQLAVDPDNDYDDDNGLPPQPLSNPATPKWFNIVEGRIRDQLTKIAEDYGLTYTVLGEQFWFMKEGNSLKIVQSLDDPTELIVSSPGGTRQKWRALDWCQFEAALDGKINECFFKSPRQEQLEESDGSSGAPKARVGISWEAEEVLELRQEFSLTNLYLHEVFEEIADDLLMRFNTIEHGFSLISDERNVQLSLTDHGDDGILLERYEDGELADDTVWARLDFLQFAYAVRGRALKALLTEHEEDEDEGGGEVDEEDEIMEVEVEMEVQEGEDEHEDDEDEVELLPEEEDLNE